MDIYKKLSGLNRRIRNLYEQLDNSFRKQGGLLIDIYCPMYQTSINRAILLGKNKALELLISKDDTKLGNDVEKKLIINLRNYMTKITMDYSLTKDKINMEIIRNKKTRKYKNLTLDRAKEIIIKK